MLMLHHGPKLASPIFVTCILSGATQVSTTHCPEGSERLLAQVFQQHSRQQHTAAGQNGARAQQGALQGSTAAMEQQLLTAEATMQVRLLQHRLKLYVHWQ